VRLARDLAASVVDGDSAATALAKVDGGLLQRLGLGSYVAGAAFLERYEQMKHLPAPA